jgi:hypothetical protein
MRVRALREALEDALEVLIYLIEAALIGPQDRSSVAEVVAICSAASATWPWIDRRPSNARPASSAVSLSARALSATGAPASRRLAAVRSSNSTLALVRSVTSRKAAACARKCWSNPSRLALESAYPLAKRLQQTPDLGDHTV